MIAAGESFKDEIMAALCSEPVAPRTVNVMYAEG
jgi:hypothetical protein